MSIINYKNKGDQLFFINIIHKEIAVMGDTSSGKSSLLSALSQIELPSNDQITTRCPLRLRMEKSDRTYARIGIKWHITSSYRDDKGWSVVEVNSWDIQKILSEAQDYILALSKSEVARDVVEVYVYGPDCVDLTLVDLPGIVRSVGKQESDTLVTDIKNLIDESLQNERCVILAVVPANVDFHNSQIMADAKVVDKDTRRTIPVITKPDLIDKGAEKSVYELLLGKKMDFMLGFNMVKCRGQDSLNKGTSLLKGIQEEAHFFNSQEPWSKESNRSLFGVEALRTKLANLQVQMIKESIPSILADIKHKLKECDAKLAIMGAVVSTSAERRRFFLTNGNEALDLLKSELEGSSDKFKMQGMTVIAAEQERMMLFGEKILKQKLANIMLIEPETSVIVTFVDGTTEKGIIYCVEKVSAIDYAYVKPLSTAKSTRFLKAPSEVISAVLGVQYEINKYYYGNVPFRCDATGLAASSIKGSYLIRFPMSSIRSDPTWIKQLIHSNRNLDLACFLNYQLFKKIVSDMVKEQWRPLCIELLSNSVEMMETLVKKCTHSVKLNRFPLLLAFLEDQISLKLNSIYQGTTTDLENLLDMNKSPFTQNHYLFENIQKQRNQALQRKLIMMLENNKGDSAATVAIVKAAFDETSKMNMDDHVASEMQIFLDSYGKVAAKRIIDEVPMLLIKQTNVICDVIRSIINEVSDDQLKELMMENPNQVRMYNQVMEEKGKMMIAYNAFKELQFF